ncbi:hypothetical protein NEOKW01_0874 [Nematocida sp. AWRm80]|nr:hypothetical protein NEOKW01_0874 [Nematocida sp. AWRm80]
MDTIKEKEQVLRDNISKGNYELLEDLSKYIEEIVLAIENKEYNKERLIETIESEKEIHRLCMQLFEETKSKSPQITTLEDLSLAVYTHFSEL